MKDIYTSPSGIACDPWVNAPDKRFHPDGRYSVKLKLPEAHANGLIDLIKEEISKAENEERRANPKKKNKRHTLPYYWERDENDLNTGFVLFKFVAKAKILTNYDRINQSLPIYDQDGNPTSLTVNEGAVIRVSFQVYSYNSPAIGIGVILRLSAVQIIKHVTIRQLSAEDYGFK